MVSENNSNGSNNG